MKNYFKKSLIITLSALIAGSAIADDDATEVADSTTTITTSTTPIYELISEGSDGYNADGYILTISGVNYSISFTNPINYNSSLSETECTYVYYTLNADRTLTEVDADDVATGSTYDIQVAVGTTDSSLSLTTNGGYENLLSTDTSDITLYMKDLTNGSTTTGGAVWNKGEQKIESITGAFLMNVGKIASNGGGGIYNGGNATLNTINAAFIGNSTTGCGGAIFNGGTIQSITGTFIGNKASLQGGAIYNKLSITDTISADFIANTSGTGGGAIYNTSTINSINGTFIGNAAGTVGGAICNYGGTISGISGTFTGNTASDSGGAIYNTGTIKITTNGADTVFTGNTTGNSSDGYTSNAIYQTAAAKTTFSATDSYKIIVNDGITGANGSTLTISTGTTVFNNSVSGSAITVDSGATLALGSYAGTSDLASASSANISSALTVNGTLSLVVSASKSTLANNISISGTLTLNTGSSVALDLSEIFGSFDLSVTTSSTDLLAYFDSNFESSLLTVIFADSSFSSSISKESYTAGDGETYDYVVKDSTGEEILAAFSVDNTTSGTITISGFSNVAVPEPSTYAMIIGALALGFAYYRRRK